MLIDSCIINNELDMLEFRMRYLWDIVDKFVVVENNRTFTGILKPYNVEAAKGRFEWAKEKLVYYPVSVECHDLDLSYRPTSYNPDAPQWKMEKRQRGKIIEACKFFSDDDILMISDCDEIPTPDAIKTAVANKHLWPMTFDQYIVFYNLKRANRTPWGGTIIAHLSRAREMGTSQMRDCRERFRVIRNGGYHLSYFGGPDRVKRKIESFSHTELNKPEFTEMEKISEHLENGTSLFGEDDSDSVFTVQADFYPKKFVSLAPKEWWK